MSNHVVERPHMSGYRIRLLMHDLVDFRQKSYLFVRYKYDRMVKNVIYKIWCIFYRDLCASPNQLLLSLDGYYVPPHESSSILQVDELVEVRVDWSGAAGAAAAPDVIHENSVAALITETPNTLVESVAVMLQRVRSDHQSSAAAAAVTSTGAAAAAADPAAHSRQVADIVDVSSASSDVSTVASGGGGGGGGGGATPAEAVARTKSKCTSAAAAAATAAVITESDSVVLASAEPASAPAAVAVAVGGCGGAGFQSSIKAKTAALLAGYRLKQSAAAAAAAAGVVSTLGSVNSGVKRPLSPQLATAASTKHRRHSSCSSSSSTSSSASSSAAAEATSGAAAAAAAAIPSTSTSFAKRSGPSANSVACDKNTSTAPSTPAHEANSARAVRVGDGAVTSTPFRAPDAAAVAAASHHSSDSDSSSSDDCDSLRPSMPAAAAGTVNSSAAPPTAAHLSATSAVIETCAAAAVNAEPVGVNTSTAATQPGGQSIGVVAADAASLPSSAVAKETPQRRKRRRRRGRRKHAATAATAPATAATASSSSRPAAQLDSHMSADVQLCDSGMSQAAVIGSAGGGAAVFAAGRGGGGGGGGLSHRQIDNMKRASTVAISWHTRPVNRRYVFNDDGHMVPKTSTTAATTAGHCLSAERSTPCGTGSQSRVAAVTPVMKSSSLLSHSLPSPPPAQPITTTSSSTTTTTTSSSSSSSQVEAPSDSLLRPSYMASQLSDRRSSLPSSSLGAVAGLPAASRATDWTRELTMLPRIMRSQPRVRIAAPPPGRLSYRSAADRQFPPPAAAVSAVADADADSRTIAADTLVSSVVVTQCQSSAAAVVSSQSERLDSSVDRVHSLSVGLSGDNCASDSNNNNNSSSSDRKRRMNRSDSSSSGIGRTLDTYVLQPDGTQLPLTTQPAISLQQLQQQQQHHQQQLQLPLVITRDTTPSTGRKCNQNGTKFAAAATTTATTTTAITFNSTAKSNEHTVPFNKMSYTSDNGHSASNNNNSNNNNNNNSSNNSRVVHGASCNGNDSGDESENGNSSSDDSSSTSSDDDDDDDDDGGGGEVYNNNNNGTRKPPPPPQQQQQQQCASGQSVSADSIANCNVINQVGQNRRLDKQRVRAGVSDDLSCAAAAAATDTADYQCDNWHQMAPPTRSAAVAQQQWHQQQAWRQQPCTAKVLKDDQFYGQFPVMQRPARPNDIIAFKQLQLAADYTPHVSDYREARVLQPPASAAGAAVRLELLEAPVSVPRRGRFELELDSDGDEVVDLEAESGIVELVWSQLIEPRLMFP